MVKQGDNSLTVDCAQVCLIVLDKLDACLLLLPELEVAVNTARDDEVSGSGLGGGWVGRGGAANTRGGAAEVRLTYKDSGAHVAGCSYAACHFEYNFLYCLQNVLQFALEWL
jgi:hypothetical protein